VSEPPIERHHTATAYVVAGGRTLLLWHHKLKMWLPPGGHLELNEDPVQGALREALEESGLEVRVIPPSDLLVVSQPEVVAPPAVILIEDIVRADQPFHQHIDHVYFTRALVDVDFAAPIPHGAHHWFNAEELSRSFSLPAPDGTLVRVAEDVRLLGLRALQAATLEP
jgi:ADP-ribose pyrophosphatase YjhB (NUDIX family)